MSAEEIAGAPDGEGDPDEEEPEDKLEDGFKAFRIMHRRIMSALRKNLASEKKAAG